MAPAKIVSEPQPGYYKTKFNSNSVDVPVKLTWIECELNDQGEPDTDSYMLMTVNGRNTYQWSKILDMWARIDEIPEAEYNFLLAKAEWAREHAPTSPQANPHKPVDLNKEGPIF